MDRLLDAALELSRADNNGSSEWYSQVVAALHARPVQAVFDRCVAWCASADASERRLGADVLGQLGGKGRAFPFRAAAIPVLTPLLSDPDLEVVDSTLVALGHLRARDAVAEVVALAEHPEAHVRHSVTFALLGDDRALAVEAMIQLSSDDDPEVRDWATFGLGSQIDVDTEAVREALLARADDTDEDIQAEALNGLAKRKDPRVVLPLCHALSSEAVGSLVVEAAREAAAVELVPALESLRSWWDLDAALLEDAIARCRGTSQRNSFNGAEFARDIA